MLDSVLSLLEHTGNLMLKRFRGGFDNFRNEKVSEN